MRFRIDRQSRVSYPTQVERQAAAQMVAGRVHPGERMPSVRQLARELDVSRTTAERIHGALCEAMLVEVRPRSGIFAAATETRDRSSGLRWALTVYRLVEETAAKARALGIGPASVARLLATLDADATPRPTPNRKVVLPLLATLDAFECMRACLPPDFPAELVHVPPSGRVTSLPGHSRYLLCGYYLRNRARLLAEREGASLLSVRYNVKLLDQAMTIAPGEHREFITRDPDNAETTRGMLASAYPEVPQQNYAVLPIAEWNADAARASAAGEVWVTPTVEAAVREQIPASRIHALHPMLAEDFVEELRCLALFLDADAS
jgi:DNA-binding transcriptional regulator YhcF (GntR family)